MTGKNWKQEFIDWYGDLIDINNQTKEAREYFYKMESRVKALADDFHMFFDKTVMGREKANLYLEFSDKQNAEYVDEDIEAAISQRDPEKMLSAVVNASYYGFPKDLQVARSYHKVAVETVEALEAAEAAEIERADRSCLDDYMDAADRYQRMQEDRRARLDAELEEYKVELAQKKLEYKEMRKEASKQLHPINFVARWGVRIKQRIAANNALKSYMQDFQEGQKAERDEIENGLRQLDVERKNMQNGYANRDQDAAWKTTMQQKTQNLNAALEVQNDERNVATAQAQNPLRRSAGVEGMLQNNVQHRGSVSRNQPDKQPKSKEEIQFF